MGSNIYTFDCTIQYKSSLGFPDKSKQVEEKVIAVSEDEARLLLAKNIPASHGSKTTLLTATLVKSIPLVESEEEYMRRVKEAGN